MFNCFCQPFGLDSRRNGAKSEKASLFSSLQVDLLSDEGATFQEDQWRLMLSQKLQQSRSAARPFYDDIVRHATPESSLQALTVLYTQHGVAKHLPSINASLTVIRPFVLALSTLCSSHPEIACLVWGSVQVLYQVNSCLFLCLGRKAIEDVNGFRRQGIFI